MKKLRSLTSAPARLSVAMPLILGLATIAAAPTVEAVSINEVDIRNGLVDVNEDGITDGADNLADAALWCNDAAAVKLDIINGRFDVNEGGAANADDDLLNCDFTDENDIGGALGVPTANQGDIINGLLDINESGIVDSADDAPNINLFVLP